MLQPTISDFEGAYGAVCLPEEWMFVGKLYCQRSALKLVEACRNGTLEAQATR